VADQPAVKAIAARLGETTSAVGLGWLLQHARNVLLIAGTSRIDHLEANLRVGDLELDPESVAALDFLTPAT